ncbi:MAG: peptidoglycan-binding protein [Pseudomonadota bacterium]|nr:peptidoglycan-binding protein [Pseudomonadota bacterium]
MASTIAPRLSALTADANVDLEDILYALQLARADGRLSPEELAELKAAVAPYESHLEPAARRLVDDLLASRAALVPRRVLLAATPANAADMYQPRAEVVSLQDALTALGHPTASDGVYGKGTAALVATFQAGAHLPQTGQVDTATLLAMNERLAAAGKKPLDLAPRARIRPDQVIALRGGTNRDDNRAIQAGLGRLGAQWGDNALRVEADGAFGPGTEAAVKAFQRRVYLPDSGIVDRTTLGALDDVLLAHGLPLVNITGPAAGAGLRGAVELHFYPGDTERKVYVVSGGKDLDRYGMVGGQNRFKDDPDNPTVDYGPSPSGTYSVIRVSPHASGAWAWSYVPYGSQLREVDGEVQYRDLDGAWRWATGPQSVFARRNPPPLPRASYLDTRGQLYDAWRMNDFGHLRGQLKSVRTGVVQGHMIHSSPHQEGTAAYFRDTDALLDPKNALDVLDWSHGCEHLHPRDFDEMVARGYLAPGTTFVVHGYDEVRTAAPAGPAIA